MFIFLMFFHESKLPYVNNNCNNDVDDDNDDNNNNNNNNNNNINKPKSANACLPCTSILKWMAQTLCVGYADVSKKQSII